MKKKIYILLFICLIIFKTDRLSAMITLSTGINGGIMPSPGGNLSSYIQSGTLGVDNGIDGINRSESGLSTGNIGKLLGASAGVTGRVFISDYYMIRMAVNYTMSITGGTGETIDLSSNVVETTYSVWLIDVPITAGISIPFWKDVRISLSGGLALGYGNYSNSFKSAALNSSASFSGWAFPVVFIISGEYFITNSSSLITSISYYKGSSTIIKSGSDYAKIDFTGYRWNVGISFFFDMQNIQL